MQEPTDDERWLPIPSWEGIYEVSDQGRVRSLDRVVTTVSGVDRRMPGRPVLGHRRQEGSDVRWVITLRKPLRVEKHYLYTLVLLAFVGPRPSGDTVDARHLDGDTDNNVLANLAWGTRAENMADMVRHGRHRSMQRTCCPRSHPLEPPNLVPLKSGGGRDCLACNRASSAVGAARRRGKRLDFIAEANRQYLSLMQAPGRRQGKAVGENASNAVMTEEAVRAMRREHAQGSGIKALVDKYGVKKSQVWNIVARKSWQHVS